MSQGKYEPLSDLERFELLQAMYPDRLTDDSDLGDEEEILEDIGIDPEAFDEIMGRAVWCATPLRSPLTGKAAHVLGRVSIVDDHIHMVAAVKREIPGGDS